MSAVERTPKAPSSWADLSPAERAALQYAVEQFLYDEAALLDARKYREWFAVVAEDIHYWMPIRRTVTRSDLEFEFTKPGAMAYFDDDYELLEMRVKKLEAKSAWSEDPPSRSRHRYRSSPGRDAPRRRGAPRTRMRSRSCRSTTRA